MFIQIKMHSFITVLLFFSATPLYAQQQYNLVPNSSFEQYTNCPYYLANLQNDKPDYWYKPDSRGARYFNACANGYDNNYNGMPINFFWGGAKLSTRTFR